MGHQTSAAIARRRLRRFNDEHGRVFAHLKSGTVVATLAGEVSLAAGMPRADVFVCGARVRNVMVTAYEGGDTARKGQGNEQGRGKRGGKGARHGER